ncbi:MAG: hypothetical protein CEE38_18280 [Planctomycetes bacterium B3_Pla]|nr:MAG: hypothetical protein CEE38_18280 [Planctomycetes bacterium B3_Pla]
MKKGCFLALAVMSLVLPPGDAVWAEDSTFEYPCYLLDAYDADDSCWTGMDAQGRYKGPVRVVPQRWLIGPPPSEKSGVTLPPDHWVEIQFRGPIVDGPGDDIVLIEVGPVREQARVFITDGFGREYLLGMAMSGSVGAGVDPTEIGFDISGIALPYVPRAVRILGIDNGGGAPGFDVANVRARVSNDCGDIACNPIPVDAAKNMPADAILSWSPGQFAEKHAVYLGTDVTDLSEFLPPQDTNSFDPCGLDLSTTYYWRIDEVNDQNVRPGEVWSFTTIDHFVVDDFEQYNSSTDPNPNWISDTWKNFGVYLSTDHAHKCGKKSMAIPLLDYQTAEYSDETVRTFIPPQDWTAAGAKVLELFFSDLTDNSAALIYIALNDGNTEAIVPYPGDANDVTKETWHPWRIELQKLQDIDLSNIESIAIGFYADPNNPSGDGSGTVYFDDITLYSSRCFEDNRPPADLNGDCIVNLPDLEEIAYSWLKTGHNSYTVAAPNVPVAWYKFDGNADDSIGSAHGALHGNPIYASGMNGLAISFDGYNDSVELTGAGSLFSGISMGITIAFWQYGADSPHHTDTLCCSNYDYDLEDPAIAINLGCWRQPGKYNWDCGRPWSFDGRLSGYHRYKSEWSGRWNHWAFTKDVRTGKMQIFLNGMLYDSRTGANSPISGITSFEIGSGWYGGYDGLIDDFRIYNYALSQPEIAHVATNGTGIFDLPLMIPADFNGDNQVNFTDFALLADNWLENGFWP